MNSVLIRNNLSAFFQKLNPEQKKLLFAKGMAYHSALTQGLNDLKDRHDDFLLYTLKCQKETDVTIIKSPDGNYLAALSSLAAVFVEYYKKEIEKQTPEKGEESFTSVYEADEWLKSHPTIVPTKLNTSARSTLGLFANHSVVSLIRIEYTDMKRATGYMYGMAEVEKTQLFITGKPYQAIEKWKNNNPECDVILTNACSNVRGSATALAFGFGSDRVEHIKVFLIYRKKAADNTQSKLN